MLPLCTLEDHFLSRAFEQKYPEKYASSTPGPILDRLRDMSALRLKEMDSGNLTLQIISHVPADVDAALSAAMNDELAAAVSAHPSRLAGFAHLPMSDPPAAAAELKRAVRDLGFVGALVDNHLDSGEYYDAEKFWPVFEAAQDVDVPVYIHPAFPTEAMMKVLYKGNYPEAAEFSLGMAGFGWHADTALHVLRLFAAGVFDRFPRLKVIIGHMGEMLPFQLERICGLTGPFGINNRERDLKTVWDTNIWITTSGMFSLNPMACLLRNTKKDRIMYSVDWPFAKNEVGAGFMKTLSESGMVTESELEGIAYGNAEKLLGVKVKG